MKNLILILLLVNFSLANENNNDNFDEEFNSEFSTKKEEIFDPLGGYNRLMTTFNDKVFINVLNPIAESYAYVTPETVRIGINNFFQNIMFPVRFSNNLLQLKFKNSSEELGRFLVNTLWGLGGFMDPATKELNMKAHKEDFGQTLGAWGAGSGAYIVLPVFGPSNVRDTVGMVADAVAFSFVVPSNIQDETAYKVVQYGIKPVNTRANNDFRYHETGSPFEYELVRYVTTEGRRLAVME